MKDFSPHTRQQDEREITVVQKDFSGGVFNDIAASTIPANGVAYLENFVNKGTELVGRTGSKKWGDYSTGTAHAALPARATGIEYSSIMNIDGTEHIVTITSGYSPSSSDIGSFFVFSYGENEEIIRFEDGNLITRNRSNYQSQSGTGSIRGKVNGIYYHRYLNKIILILDTDIYISYDIYITSWVKAYCKSFHSLANEISSIDEKDNYLLIANQNGIFKLPLDSTPYYYYKINSDVPSGPTNQLAKGVNDVYCRRYIYSLSKMDTNEIDGTRFDSTTVVYLDSGTNKVADNNLDYSEGWSENPISSTDPMLVRQLVLPSLDGGSDKEYHWDCYSIWGTTDCGENGTDPVLGTATNTEQYIWIKDIPIMKSLVVTIDGTDGTVIDGSVSVSDVGSFIRVLNGAIIESLTIETVDEDLNTFTTTTTLYVTSVPATIGATYFGAMTYNSGTKTFTITGSGSTMTSDDVGKRVFLSNGYKVYISSVPTANTFVTTDSPVVLGTISGCWGPEQGRNFNDVITDDELRGRISGFPCYQRRYENIPSADIICYSAGFLFTATRDDNYVYYSQIPEGFDYMVGYYHPAYQLAHIKDGIRSIKSLLDKVVVYGYNSTSVIPTNTYSSVTFDDGRYIAVVPNVTVIDEIVGCIAYGSIQKLENGNHILITNEPAIKIFNGSAYSDNLATKKMMNVIKKLQQNIVSMYSSLTGYLFWGTDE